MSPPPSEAKAGGHWPPLLPTPIPCSTAVPLHHLPPRADFIRHSRISWRSHFMPARAFHSVSPITQASGGAEAPPPPEEKEVGDPHPFLRRTFSHTRRTDRTRPPSCAAGHGKGCSKHTTFCPKPATAKAPKIPAAPGPFPIYESCPTAARRPADSLAKLPPDGRAGRTRPQNCAPPAELSSCAGL